MNYKLLLMALLVIIILLALFIVYKFVSSVEQKICDKITDVYNKQSNYVIENVQNSLDQHAVKIKNISMENIQQLKRINMLNHQPITQIANHFSETDDSDVIKTDIKHMSDSALTLNHDNNYYMSEDSATSDMKLTNDIDIYESKSMKLPIYNAENTSLSKSFINKHNLKINQESDDADLTSDGNFSADTDNDDEVDNKETNNVIEKNTEKIIYEIKKDPNNPTSSESKESIKKTPTNNNDDVEDETKSSASDEDDNIVVVEVDKFIDDKKDKINADPIDDTANFIKNNLKLKSLFEALSDNEESNGDDKKDLKSIYGNITFGSKLSKKSKKPVIKKQTDKKSVEEKSTNESVENDDAKTNNTGETGDTTNKSSGDKSSNDNSDSEEEKSSKKSDEKDIDLKSLSALNITKLKDYAKKNNIPVAIKDGKKWRQYKKGELFDKIKEFLENKKSNNNI